LIFDEFRSVSSEIRRRKKKEEERKKESVVKHKSADRYVGWPNDIEIHSGECDSLLQ